MRIRWAVALAGLLLGAWFIPAVQAREKAVKLQDLPEAVKQTVLEVSKGVKLRALMQEVDKGKTFYEAELDVDGRARDVIIDESGAIVLIEEEVPWDSVPAAVRAAIERGAEGRKILYVVTLTRNNILEAYEAHVRKGWWGETEIKVNPEGRPIREK